MKHRGFTFKSMSESTITGDFPPSSNTTGVKCFAAADITIRPTFEFPAKGHSGVKINPNVFGEQGKLFY